MTEETVRLIAIFKKKAEQKGDIVGLSVQDAETWELIIKERIVAWAGVLIEKTSIQIDPQTYGFHLQIDVSAENSSPLMESLRQPVLGKHQKRFMPVVSVERAPKISP